MAAVSHTNDGFTGRGDPRIYVRLDQNRKDGYEYDWYAINDPEWPPYYVDGIACLRPWAKTAVPNDKTGRLRDSSCVAVGSFIYVIGGGNEETYTYYIDCDNAVAKSWTPLARLNTPRKKPCVFEWNGKIVAFSPADEPFSEVFDPKNQEEGWVVLHSKPPIGFPDYEILGYHWLHDGRVLMIHRKAEKCNNYNLSTSLCIFDVDHDVVVDKFGTSYHRRVPSAIVDGILYCLSLTKPGRLCGFEFSKVESSRIPVKFESEPHDDKELSWLPKLNWDGKYYMPPNHFLLSLGDHKLAILWSSEDHLPSIKPNLFIWCSIWKLSKGGTFDDIELVASHISLDKYWVKDFGSIVDCLAVDKRGASVHGAEVTKTEEKEEETLEEENGNKALSNLLGWTTRHVFRDGNVVAAGIFFGIVALARLRGR